MNKPMLQMITALTALPSVVFLPGCSKRESTRGNDQSTQRVVIDCDCPGASAEEVASLVTHPIEMTLSSIPHIKNVSSASRPGRAIVWVEFEPGMDLFESRQAVAQRLKVVTSSLPDGTNPMLTSQSSDEVLLIALHAKAVPEAAEKQVELAGQLRDLAEYSLRPRLLTVSDVSSVSITGGLRKRFEVVASQERLRALNLTLMDLATAIQQANTTTADDKEIENEREFLVRSVSPVRNLEDLANTIIAMRDDRPVRVKDVAEARIGWTDEDDPDNGIKEKRDPARFGGVILAVQIAPNSDQQTVSKKIDEALKQLQDDLPSGIKIARSINQRFDDLVRLAIQKLERERPPGWAYQRRSTKQLGDHLVAGKSDLAVIKIIGPDLEVLRSNAEEMLGRLSKVPGVADLRVDPPADIPELKVKMDQEASKRFGMSSDSLSNALSVAIFGKVVAQIREGNQLIDVLVKVSHSVDRAEIGRHFIRTESGELVPLHQLAKLKVVAAPSAIYSENLQPVVVVSYSVTGREKSDVLTNVQKVLEPVQRSLDRLDGKYRIEPGR